jgi:hypothetical protein
MFIYIYSMKVQEKIFGNHEFLSCSYSISNQDEEQDLVTLSDT